MLHQISETNQSKLITIKKEMPPSSFSSFSSVTGGKFSWVENNVTQNLSLEKKKADDSIAGSIADEEI